MHGSSREALAWRPFTTVPVPQGMDIFRVFRDLWAIFFLLVQDVSLSRCSLAGLGPLFSFGWTNIQRQCTKPFSIFTLLLTLS